MAHAWGPVTLPYGRSRKENNGRMQPVTDTQITNPLVLSCCFLKEEMEVEVKGWNGGRWFYFGVANYCFPSINCKNEALAGQDMHYVLLISTSQDRQQERQEVRINGGVCWIMEVGKLLSMHRTDQCGWSSAYWPRGCLGPGRPFRTGSQCGHCVRLGGTGPSMPLYVDPNLASWSKGQVRASDPLCLNVNSATPWIWDLGQVTY